MITWYLEYRCLRFFFYHQVTIEGYILQITEVDTQSMYQS